MRQSRFDWHERIKAVEREYWAVRTALDQLSDAIARDVTVLGKESKPRDVASASEKLEGTYLVRMFAEFETAIRSYWRTIKPKARTRVEVLVDRVADRLAIPASARRGVHAVREYRNHLVHERDLPSTRSQSRMRGIGSRPTWRVCRSNGVVETNCR